MLTTFFVEDGAVGGTGAPNDPFGSIQDAIDAAADSRGPDTVNIGPGDYQEILTIEDSDKLTIKGNGATVDPDDDDEHVIEIDDSGDISIRDLTVSGGKDGINADDVTSLILTNVQAIDNADEGVSVEDAGSVMVVGGNYSGNLDDGFKVETADTVTIVGGTFSDNDNFDPDPEERAGDGIDLEDVGAIHVTNVTAERNGDEGFEVDDSASVDVVGGTFSDNIDEGLDIDNSGQVRITGVVANGNGGSGFQFEADDTDFPVDSISITNSVFEDNGVDGVQIVEDGSPVGKVRVTNVAARDNTEKGFNISVSGQANIKNMVSENNGEADELP